MTVYLDVVFLENFVMNLVIILSEAVLLGGFKKFFRKFIASIILSAFYIATLFYAEVAMFQIVAALIAVWVSFEPKSIKKLLKELLLFYFISFISFISPSSNTYISTICVGFILSLFRLYSL